MTNPEAPKKKLILDLDTGIDDTLAIAYALGSEEVELIGITGTFGNVLVDTGVRNSLAVLDLLGHPEVPVYRGVDHPRAADSFSLLPIIHHIHGRNGIGNCEIPDSTRAPQPGSAVDFIIEAAHAYGPNLLYVPTGPLTTLAAVLDIEPDIAQTGMQVTLMGGALAVPGNVTPCSEANIANDPEAADVVLRSSLPTTMVGLDVTLQAMLPKTETAAWRAIGTPAARFLADMTDFYIDFYTSRDPYMVGCSLHDPLAVATAIDPTLVGTLDINLMVDLEGAERGRTIGNPELLANPHKTSKAALTVDAERFLREFVARTTRALKAAPAC
ncbi:MAG: nucleoside hydrolase [Coriobacteriia bacterium]|nr:nucleoside hydrolase [Coriobacteriia bacterium]MBS5477110.1 nucleoside hydrolase [Coriobacteriia bacterium]